LARELHDTVKQQTFATLMQVRAARNRLAADPGGAGSAAADHHLAEAEEIIRTSEMELGRLVAELRPAGLEGQGLAKALRAYAATWAEQSHIPAAVSIQNERTLPLDTEQTLYRVAQEALANAARHSRASAISLRLVYAPTSVSLTVSDNGVGFDPRAHAAGFGLESMRQRLAELRGRLTVETSPAGTTVQAEVDT
jgi:NarL family two-component system sensor histidine kinase LiaS